PLFARMIVETREDVVRSGDVTGELDLYRRYTTTCLNRRQEYVEPAEARGATAEIALWMYVEHTSALATDTILKRLALYKQERSTQFWREWVARDVVLHGFLVPEGDQRFRFSHLSLEHYFLAERLAEELTDLSTRKVLSKLFGHAR